jgi:predicted nucleic acid-binding protein
MAVRLLDTNIVSFNMRSHSLGVRYRPHLAGHVLAVSFQTVAELLYGGALARWGNARWAALEQTLGAMLVLESDQNTCERWAEIRVARRARPIAVADCWIAATALAHGLELVTHNPADFAHIPGLVVITEAP